MQLNRSHRKEAILVKGIYYLHSPIGFANIQIARFMGPTWGPSEADRTQVGPCWPHEPCYLGILRDGSGLRCFVSVLWVASVIGTFKHFVNISRVFSRILSTCSSLWLISMGQHSWWSPARAIITSCHENAFRMIRPSQSTDNGELCCFTALVVAPTSC